MVKLRSLLVFSVLLTVLLLSWQASQAPGTIRAAGSQVSPELTPLITQLSRTREPWIWLDLPAGASQLELGAEIYRLVCSTCHAYDGTGLTDEWRATWNPKDQNCWQSKCHGPNHPSDGFFLPPSPAIVGPVIPALFETAYDLYEYNLYRMPWHNPNSLPEEQAWAVTAYVLFLNGIDSGPNLNADTAANLRLRPAASTEMTLATETLAQEPSPTHMSEPEPVEDLGSVLLIAGSVLALSAALGLLLLRRIKLRGM